MKIGTNINDDYAVKLDRVEVVRGICLISAYGTGKTIAAAIAKISNTTQIERALDAVGGMGKYIVFHDLLDCVFTVVREWGGFLWVSSPEKITSICSP